MEKNCAPVTLLTVLHLITSFIQGPGVDAVGAIQDNDHVHVCGAALEEGCGAGEQRGRRILGMGAIREEVTGERSRLKCLLGTSGMQGRW